MKNRALTFIVTVLSVSFLYSATYFFLPLKKMADICLIKANVQGQEVCALPLSIVYLSFYMLLPLICALILQKLVYKEKLSDIGFSFKWTPWYFYAWLAPVAVALLALAIGTAFPGVTLDPHMTGYLDQLQKKLPVEQFEVYKKQVEGTNGLLLVMILQGLIAGVTINALFAFGEEAGWRGFLLSALKEKNFYLTSLIIGAVWGVWHFPVVLQGHNYPEHPLAGVFMFIAFCILITPLMVYAVKKTGSAISAAVFHGTLNAVGGIVIIFSKGGNDLTTGVGGAAMLMALLAADIVLFVYDRFIEKEKVII